MRIEEGTDSEADSEFLMELMDINEVLNEAQTAGEAEQIGRDVQGTQICKLALTSQWPNIDPKLVQAVQTFSSDYQVLLKVRYGFLKLSALGGIFLSYHSNKPPLLWSTHICSFPEKTLSWMHLLAGRAGSMLLNRTC